MFKLYIKILFTNILILIFALIIFLPTIHVFAEVSTDTKTIKVGLHPLNGLSKYNIYFNPYKYELEYLKEIEKYSNIKFQYVKSNTWEESLEKLKHKEIDILSGAQYTEERSQWLTYSNYSNGDTFNSIVTLVNNDNIAYEDFKSLNNLTIGCTKNYAKKEDFLRLLESKNCYPKILYYSNFANMQEALYKNQIDAMTCNIMDISEKEKLICKFSPSPFYYVCLKENRTIMEYIDKAIGQIKIHSPSLENDLFNKYYNSNKISSFTKSQLNFIKGCPTINVGCYSNKTPFSYWNKEKEKFCGIEISILDLISTYSGIKFNYVPIPNDKLSVDELKRLNIKLVTNVEHTSLNESIEDLHLSIPYLFSEKLLLCKQNKLLTTNMKLKIAITKELSLDNLIKTYYPNFKIIKYETIDECIKAVSKGYVDVTLQNRYIIDKYLYNPDYYKDLRIIPNCEIFEQIGLATVNNINSSDTDILISIINKSISMLSNTEITQCIINNTVYDNYEIPVKYFIKKYSFQIISISILIIIYIFLITYVIKTKNKNISILKENEKTLMNITNNINGAVIVLVPDRDFTISYMNNGFLDLVDYRKDDIKNRTFIKYTDFLHKDDISIFIEAIKNMKKNNKNDLILNNLKIKKSDGTYIPILFRGTMSLNSKGEKVIFCIIVDNTHQKLILDASAKENENLKNKILRDPFTDLYTKDAFNIITSDLLEKKKDTDTFSFLFIDLDNFKSINDNLGHMFGDKVLMDVSNKINKFFRKEDIIGRFGGDELCVFAKNIPLSLLNKKVKNLCKIINHTYKGENNKKITISASIGISLSPHHGSDLPTLMEKADKALYIAKENGKNQFVIYNNKLTPKGYVNNR